MNLHSPSRRAPSGWRPETVLMPFLVFLLGCGMLQGVRAQDDLKSLRALMKQRDFATVLRRVSDLAASNKADVEVALLGAHAARELREWGQAGSLGSLATQLAPTDSDGRPQEHRGFEAEAHALWGAAQEIIQAGRPSGLTRASFLDAGSFYRRAREHGGDDYSNGMWEAEAYRLGQDFEAALVGVRAALEKQGDNWDARILHARILLDLARFEPAVEALVSLRSIQPKDPEVAHLLLRAMLGTDDRGRIAKTFLELLRVFPADLELYVPFAERFGSQQPRDFFRGTMLAASRLRPVSEDRVPAYYLSWIAQQEGRYEDALAHMIAYRDARPLMPDGYAMTAKILAGHLGRHEDARPLILKANALGGLEEPRLLDGFGAVISGYVGARDYGPAIDLQRVVVSIRRDANSELNLARLTHDFGQRHEAVALLKRLLTRRDAFEDLLIAEIENDLALYQMGLGAVEEAEKSLRRSILASTDKLDATENLGILLLDRGATDEGLALLRRCLEREPGRHRSRYHLLRARYPGLFGDPGR